MTGTDDKAAAAIRETAAEWLVRLNDADARPQERVAFTAWLRASPLHVREYLRAEATWLALQEAACRDDSEVSELLTQAQTNVVDLRSIATEPAPLPSRSTLRTFRRYRAAITATALLAIVGALALLLPNGPDANTYATGIGEMRRVVLPDGSAIELNTDSRIRVDFNDVTRDIQLERGEAFFSVAKDAARPFRAISGATVVRAVGTEFNVYRKPDETVVTVVEGRVAVQNRHDDGASDPPPAGAGATAATVEPPAAGRRGSQAGSAAIELAAGHRLRIAASSGRPIRPVVTNVDVQRAAAWRQRRLVFDNEPLADIVAEFNRYNRQQLVVADSALAAQRISGVFDPGKPQSLLRFLARDGNTATRELPGNRLLLERSNGIRQ